MGGIQCAKCFVVVFIDCGLFCVANACEQRCAYKVKEEGAAVENSDIDNSSETMMLILTPFWFMALKCGLSFSGEFESDLLLISQAANFFTSPRFVSRVIVRDAAEGVTPRM
jgi:hypothetical protein